MSGCYDGGSSITAGQTVQVCAPSQPLPGSLPDAIPANLVTVPTWSACANGNPVPQHPAACTNDLLTAVQDIQQYLFCVMSAVNVSLTSGSCNLLTVNAGKVVIDTIANALQNCLTTGTSQPAFVVGKTSPGGTPQWLPVGSTVTFIADCSQLLARLASTANGGCLPSYGTAPTSVIGFNPATGVGYYVPAAGGGAGAIGCADLQAKAKDVANAGCFPDLPQFNKVLGINAGTVGYLPAANRQALFQDASGKMAFGCLPPDIHCPAAEGQIMDPSVNVADGFRPQYRVPYRAFLLVNAGQAGAGAAVTLSAPGILNTLPLVLNREEGQGTGSWFNAATGVVTIARAGWYALSAAAYSRTSVPSTSNASYYSVYAGISVTSSIHGSSNYRIGETTYQADGQVKVAQFAGSRIMHLLPGEQVFLRTVINPVTGAAGINWAGAFLSGYLDGQAGLQIAELPGYVP